MDRNPRPASIIDTLGEEITRIITPVSICMLLVVILVSILNSDPSSSSPTIITIANLAYDEDSSDSSSSFWDKFKGALLNSLVFVVLVTLITFFLVFLFYIRCIKFLKWYMGFSSFVVLVFMGGQLALLLIDKMNLPVDSVTFCVLLFNFGIVGCLAVFMTSKMAILVTQSYLVVIGMLVAFWFTMLPEWTTWVLLVALSLYDLAAVLLPVGPLRLLVELAISRDEDIPALVYEARPVNVDESSVGPIQRRMWRRNNGANLEQNATTTAPSIVPVTQGLGGSGDETGSGSGLSERGLVDVEEGRVSSDSVEVSQPLLDRRMMDRVRTTGPNLEENPTSHLVSTDEIGSGLSEGVLVDVGEGRFPSDDPELSEPLLDQRMDRFRARTEMPNTRVNLEQSLHSEPSIEPMTDRARIETPNTRMDSGQNPSSEPLIEQRMNAVQEEMAISEDRMAVEGIGLGSSGAIKLGLGDFIFYSVLVGRAAMYDFMTAYACYLAIIAGLGVTLMLLAVYQKALPALPVSIMLGVLFYVLTRTLLEEFIVQCSTNFLMF